MRQPTTVAFPDLARSAVLMLADQLGALAVQIHDLERRLMVWYRLDQASQRLAPIPGIGIITATALSASIPDPGLFRSGRGLAAFLGSSDWSRVRISSAAKIGGATSSRWATAMCPTR